MQLFIFSRPPVLNDLPLLARHYRYAHVLMAFLALMIVLAMFVPRFLAYGPPVIGLIAFLAARPVFGVFPRVSLLAIFISIFLLVLMGVSSLWAIDPDFVIERTWKIGLIFLGGNLLLGLSLSLPTKLFDQFSRYFLGAVLIAFAILFFEFLTQGQLYKFLREIDPNSEMNYSHINRSVVTLSLLFILAVSYVWQSLKGCSKYIMLFSLFVCFAFVAMRTDSQSAHLSLIVGAFFAFIFPYKSRISWLILGFIICIGALTTPWLTQAMFASLPHIVEKYGWFQHSYAADRMEIWDFISRRALQRPIFGHGLEATRAITDFDTAMLYHDDRVILHPHNMFVQAWIEFGVFGAFVFSGFIGLILWAISKSKAGVRTALPTFMACLTAAAISYGFWQGWWLGLFWLIVSFVVIFSRKSEATKVA